MGVVYFLLSMQITLVAATLLLLGVASAKKTELPNGRMLSSSVLEFKENDYYVMTCKQRQDIIIHAASPQYAFIEHETDCLVEKKTIVPFDRSDDEWKFATMDLGETETETRLHGIIEAWILPSFQQRKLFIAYN